MSEIQIFWSPGLLIFDAKSIQETLWNSLPLGATLFPIASGFRCCPGPQHHTQNLAKTFHHLSTSVQISLKSFARPSIAMQNGFQHSPKASKTANPRAVSTPRRSKSSKLFQNDSKNQYFYKFLGRLFCRPRCAQEARGLVPRGPAAPRRRSRGRIKEGVYKP